MSKHIATLLLALTGVACGPAIVDGDDDDDDEVGADGGFDDDDGDAGFDDDAGPGDAGPGDAGPSDAGFSDGGVDGGVDEPDAGSGRFGPCASAVDVAEFFVEERCTLCHAGTTYPDLRFAALADLVGGGSAVRDATLVVPGDLEESELWRRLVGPQPDDYPGPWWMPAGTIGPHAAADRVERWITAGAPLSCPLADGEEARAPPPPPPVTDPNDLDQDLLFSCDDPSAPGSSPARLRRVNDVEFSLAAGNPTDGNFSATVRFNPLNGAERYSTMTGDAGLDETTLGLLLLTVPASSQPWVTRGQPSRVGGRWLTVFDGTPARFYSDTTPGDAERDVWVDRILRQGALFRAPSDDERARLRALLDEQLAQETAVTDRPTTLRTVASAAQLMAGALFRSEMGGGPVDGAVAGERRRLSNEELGQALGRVIGAHPVSSTLWGTVPADVGGHPDWSRADRTDGRLAAVRDAVDDGTIADPATLTALLAVYRGGVDPLRLDVSTEHRQLGDHEAVRRERGEYFLSEGIASFFREWLEVENAENVFKDTPHATSRFPDPRSNLVTTGYNLVTSRFRRETLLPMLDDTIARAVIEAEENGEDVFRALLTTRTFRVGSNLAGVDVTRPCTVSTECPSSHRHCYVPPAGGAGFCSVFGTSEINRVFNLDVDVADTRDARWVTLPAGDRAGVLTHPAFLAAHGGNFEDDASIVLRGRWVRENLMCNDVPGLELVAVPAMLGPSAPSLRARDRVREATEAPGSACLACHSEMNPWGYPFEVYNHAGFTRADDHGRAPDGSTSIVDAPDGALNRDYDDAVDFVAALADSPWARRCFIRNVFRSFMGRDETPADACTLVRLEEAFAGGSFFALLDALVTSDTFLYRHDPIPADVVGGAP